MPAYEMTYEKGYEIEYEKQNFIGFFQPHARRLRVFSFLFFLTPIEQHQLGSGKKEKKKAGVRREERRGKNK